MDPSRFLIQLGNSSFYYLLRRSCLYYVTAEDNAIFAP